MTVYQRIMRAYARGTGLLLSSESVAALARDGAIRDRAQGDDESDAQGHACDALGLPDGADPRRLVETKP